MHAFVTCSSMTVCLICQAAPNHLYFLPAVARLFTPGCLPVCSKEVQRTQLRQRGTGTPLPAGAQSTASAASTMHTTRRYYSSSRTRPRKHISAIMPPANSTGNIGGD